MTEEIKVATHEEPDTDKATSNDGEYVIVSTYLSEDEVQETWVYGGFKDYDFALEVFAEIWDESWKEEMAEAPDNVNAQESYVDKEEGNGKLVWEDGDMLLLTVAKMENHNHCGRRKEKS